MKSFLDILAEKIIEKQKPQPREIQDTSPAYLAYLLGLQSKIPMHRPTQAYPYYKPTPKPAHKLNLQQAKALDFFNQWGEELKNNFNSLELKKAYRKLAKKWHPDTQTRTSSPEKFILLKAQYEILNRLFA